MNKTRRMTALTLAAVFFILPSVLAADRAGGGAGTAAAGPPLLLDFDFSQATPAGIKDNAGSGLVLALGKAAAVRDGALVFDGSAESFAAADETKFERWAEGVDLREISGAFWIRFDKATLRGAKNADTASLGLFNCTRNDNGRLELELFAHPTEIMTDKLVMRGRDEIALGRWYHVAFNYSLNRRRYSLYIDGKWQMENDGLLLPALTLGKLKLGDGFRGAVRDLKFYDVALDSESLAIADRAAEDYDALKIAANAVGASVKNGTLKAWAGSLAKRVDTLKAGIGRTTIAQYKALRRDIANAKTLAVGISDAGNTIADQPLTVYTIPSTTQTPILPYALPADGRLSNRIELFAARGEFTSASIVVVPFRPVEKFTINISDLRSGANVIPSSNVDPKLVKRWYRTGGAWMTYHADKRQRVLTPDLLMNDDQAIRVDEVRETNELLIRFPRGDRYVDISRHAYDQTPFDWHHLPFYDAPKLQPLDLPEAGRTQQYLLTFHVPVEAAPGFYDGRVRLTAGGQNMGELAIVLRVLPFDLPEAKTYYDITRTYFSQINTFRGPHKEMFADFFRNLKEHNFSHASGVANSPWGIKIAKEIGYPLEELWHAGSPAPGSWIGNFGGPRNMITLEDRDILDRMYLRDLKKQTDYYTEHIGPDVVFYHCGASEAANYSAIMINLERGTDLYHEHSHGRLLTHGMGDALYRFMHDFNDVDITTIISKDWADIWHAAGGRTMNYADPFPSAENPAWFRRKLGLLLYKARYDGHMLHGYVERFWNEFADWPGGDGNYRNFSMAFPHRGGIINTLSLAGAREGYNDVRYATKLQQLALERRDSEDIRLAREAKRQLVWLELIDGEKADYEAFRTGAAYRILTLLELIRVREGNES